MFVRSSFLLLSFCVATMAVPAHSKESKTLADAPEVELDALVDYLDFFRELRGCRERFPSVEVYDPETESFLGREAIDESWPSLTAHLNFDPGCEASVALTQLTRFVGREFQQPVMLYFEVPGGPDGDGPTLPSPILAMRDELLELSVPDGMSAVRILPPLTEADARKLGLPAP